MLSRVYLALAMGFLVDYCYYYYYYYYYYYTVSQKKVAHCTLVHIFAKY